MNIWYFCLDPKISYYTPHRAPTIHIRETVHSLESLGHQVHPYLYADHLTGLDRLRLSKGATQPKTETTSPNSTSPNSTSPHSASPSNPGTLKPLLRDIHDLYRNSFVEPSMIRDLLRNNTIDLIYERLIESKSAVARCAQQEGIPLIVESNTTTRERIKFWGSPLAPLVHRVELDTLKRAGAITVVSTPLKRYYEQVGVPSAKITVMPNGVNEQLFALENITRDVRADLGLQDRLIVGFVGNIHPYHGIELLLPLARILKPLRADIHLLIVGAGTGLGELQQALAEEGLDKQITFVGQVPHVEIPNHIAAMDICLMPRSNAHGCPMKLLEYGVMGKAMVAPDLEPIRDILQDGETAYLFEPENVPEMAAAIVELANNSALRMKMGESAQKHILKNHTWTKNAEGIISIYRRIIGVAPATEAIAAW